MTCYAPLKAYKGQDGGIAFSVKGGYVDRHIELPCGQCLGCRIARAEQWALRCVHESQCHRYNSFITLTYRDEEIPHTYGYTCDRCLLVHDRYNPSLCVKDWQLFAKRLRKECGPFRFFHCGEYGDENLRPHYHACIFGLDFGGDRYLWKRENGQRYYRSEQLENVWDKGHVVIGDVTFESAAYVARYVMKKVNGDNKEWWYHGRRPEYITMSRRPGIGAQWFNSYNCDVYPSDEVVLNGRRFKVPRYYDSLLENDGPEGQALLSVLKAARLKRAAARSEDMSPERLAVREALAERRNALLIRNI